MNNNIEELYGYKVYRDGRIFNKDNNRELKQFKKCNSIKIKVNNKYINIPIKKFIYCAFNKNISIKDNSITIITKDKNDNNLSISNLELQYRKDLIWGENNSCSKLTNKQVEEIKHKYNSKTKDYTYRTLASEYGVSHSLISGIIKGRFRNKNNYKLNKEENNENFN